MSIQTTMVQVKAGTFMRYSFGRAGGKRRRRASRSVLRTSLRSPLRIPHAQKNRNYLKIRHLNYMYSYKTLPFCTADNRPKFVQSLTSNVQIFTSLPQILRLAPVPRRAGLANKYHLAEFGFVGRLLACRLGRLLSAHLARAAP